MIPADILIVITIVLFVGPSTWLALRWFVERKPAPDADEIDCGDQGGIPTAVELDQASRRPTAVEQQRRTRSKAPQIGCGQPVGVK